ncbi:MinD/ParA family protein [Rubeoparvulum massiliense]|uniref:MinD/ParA family protein n=1 Tax=Rubeoparvulum massiliense TaxID=1631346 RepID=UPI00065E26A6|nr:MinD/ParA family protein [Rubeoparvulum massiliense]
MNDQAQSLRERLEQMELSPRRKTRIIAVTSGKGGVGKSNFTLNFAIQLQQLGKKVMILDADLGLANLDLLLGLNPRYTLLDMVKEHLSIWEVLEEGPSGFHLLAGSSGLQELGRLEERNLIYLFEQLNQLQGKYDYILIDTGAGLSTESLRLILSADEAFIITTPEPTSLTDAYAVVKTILSKSQDVELKLLVNQVQGFREGQSTAQRLQEVTERFLGKGIQLLGTISHDSHVSKAVKQQQPLSILYPNCEASIQLQQIARRYVSGEVGVQQESTGMRRFLQRMASMIRR